MNALTLQVSSKVWFRVAAFAEAKGVSVPEAAQMLLAEVVDVSPTQMHTDEQEAMIRRLNGRGLTDASIGRLVGLSGETVRKRRGQWGLPRNGKQGRAPWKETSK